MRPVAIIPLKPFMRAKTRLAALVTFEQRMQILAEVASHVVSVIRLAGLQPVIIGPSVSDADAIADPHRGLNAAVARGLSEFGVPILIVPGDLPWITVEAVQEIVDCPEDVVVARMVDGGTGALLARTMIEPRFGPHSAVAHAAAAHRRGAHTIVKTIGGLDRDLDDSASLSLALHSAPGLSDSLRRDLAANKKPGPNGPRLSVRSF